MKKLVCLFITFITLLVVGNTNVLALSYFRCEKSVLTQTSNSYEERKNTNEKELKAKGIYECNCEHCQPGELPSGIDPSKCYVHQSFSTYYIYDAKLDTEVINSSTKLNSYTCKAVDVKSCAEIPETLAQFYEGQCKEEEMGSDFNPDAGKRSNNGLDLSDLLEGETGTCETILGGFADDLNGILKIIRIVAPILVFALSTYDYVASILSKDAEGMKKANKKFIRRLILIAVLFLLPTLINLLLGVAIDGYSNCIS